MALTLPLRHAGPIALRAVALSGGLHPVGMFFLLAGAFLPIMDFFITNVALPSIDASLHASAGELELVIAGYGVAYAALLVVGGRLGDRYGRYRLFLGALVGFVVASAVCGLAPTVGVLIVARIVQGATAALLIPQVLATFHHTLEHERKARALALYGALPRDRPRPGLAARQSVGHRRTASADRRRTVDAVRRPVPQRAGRRTTHLGGVGSGVLITLQQSGLALGVAALGTLYLALAPHNTAHAFAAVEYVQMGIVALLAVGAAALPRFTKAPPMHTVTASSETRAWIPEPHFKEKAR